MLHYIWGFILNKLNLTLLNSIFKGQKHFHHNEYGIYEYCNNCNVGRIIFVSQSIKNVLKCSSTFRARYPYILQRADPVSARSLAGGNLRILPML